MRLSWWCGFVRDPAPERRFTAMTCVLDTVRFFDEERHEWGYAVACVGEHECGYWRDLFRLPPDDGSEA